MLNAFSDCNVGGKDGTNKNSSDDNSTRQESAPEYVPSMSVKLDRDRYCRSSCSALSFLDPISKQELNKDFILECRNLCRLSGKPGNDYTYESAKRIGYAQSFSKDKADPKDSKTYKMKTQYTMMSFTSNNMPKFETQNSDQQYFSIRLDSKIKNVKLDKTYNNTIYACGHRLTSLEPTFPNILQMSYGNVFGGNVNKLASENEISKTSLTTTESLIKNNKYGGLYDFDHDSYIILNQFSDDAGDLSYLIQQNSGDFNIPSQLVNPVSQFRNGKINLKACTAQLNNYFASKGKNISTGTAEYICTSVNITQPKIDSDLYSNLGNRNLGFAYKSWWGGLNNKSDWDPDTIIYHPCFYSQSATSGLDMSTMSNDSITKKTTAADKNNKTIGLSNYPELVGCYPTWNIYNRGYADTRINVSDGDYLSVSWGGNIVVGNGITIPFIDLSIAKMIASNDKWVFNNFRNNKFKDINFLKLLSSIDFEGLDVLTGESGAVPKKKSDDDKTQVCNSKRVYDRLGTEQSPWYGLQGNIQRKSGSDIKNAPTDANADPNFNFNCKDTFLSGDRYIFSGNLTGIGKNTPLRLRYYIPSSGLESNLYKNSIINGGYQVTIEWGGCPIKDGQGLEYALADDNTKPEEIKEWKSVELKKLNGEGFSFAPAKSNNPTATFDVKYDSSKTKVYFRVNTGINNPSSAPDGSYSLKITEITDPSKEYVPWYDLTKQIAMTVFETLIGDPDVMTTLNNRSDIVLNGILIKVADSLAKALSPIMTVVLVFYMTMIGIGFMIGTIKMNQQELIKIMFKISLVLIMFSDTGRAWFVDAYIKVFIVGVIKLAAQMQNLVFEIIKYDPPTNGSAFDIFSMWKLWLYLFQQAFSKRLLALMFSSMAGFVIAIIIILAFVGSIITILKAIMSYISAIITQGILLLIAPFFFLLNLFKITGGMFQEWTKQVMGFALVPVAVSITVTLFVLLLSIGLEAAMGFSYCLSCFIKLFGACVIKTYYTMNLMFMPVDNSTSFILPIGIVSGALTFLVIAYTGMQAVEIGFGLIMRLTTFRFETFGQQSSMGNIGMNAAMSVGSTVAQGIKSNLGDRKLNPIKSWKIWRKESWDFSDVGKKDVDLGLRDEKKLDEIGKKLKALDEPAENNGPNPGNNPPGGGGGNPGGEGGNP